MDASSSAAEQRVVREPAWVRRGLIGIAIAFLGLFLFGTSRVAEFIEKGFRFLSVGNDLHHILTQAGTYVKDVESISPTGGKSWARRPSALIP